MTLQELNTLTLDEAAKQLETCCGSTTWNRELMKHFPFTDNRVLFSNATNVWYNLCNEADWLEAFSHHPKIGDIKNLSDKFASTKDIAMNEQSSVNKATDEIIKELEKLNREYEAQLGFIFIVFATGKSAAQMSRLLKDRLQNSYREELQIAMGEQHKITTNRLKNLLNGEDIILPVSQLTTHVLNTSTGKPAAGITIRLRRMQNNLWETFSLGITNEDGRIPDLLPPGKNLEHTDYKLVFATGNYFILQNMKSFYPEVAIHFTIFDDSHYHVPLLLNPFGYSTYRGS